MAVINLLIQLLAGYFYFVCIYNYYVVTAIDVRGVDLGVLPSLYLSSF